MISETPITEVLSWKNDWHLSVAQNPDLAIGVLRAWIQFGVVLFCQLHFPISMKKVQFYWTFPLSVLLIVTLWQSSDMNLGLCNGGWADKSEGGEEILVGWSYQEVIGVRTLDKEIAWGKLLAWHGRYSCMEAALSRTNAFHMCISFANPEPFCLGMWVQH